MATDLTSEFTPAVAARKQTANIYTVLLILAFLAIAIGCVFLSLEMGAYDWQIDVPSKLKPEFVEPSATTASNAVWHSVWPVESVPIGEPWIV